LGAAEPRYVLRSPGLVEKCGGLYVPLLEFNPEGIYKARLFASQSQKEPDWKLFAVVDGKEEPLTETEVFHIFQDEAVES
jgi:hypothetical protein